MPRPRRQTNIQLLNAAFKNVVKVESDNEDEPKKGMGVSRELREVNTKKKITVKKKKEDKPINTRILLTR